MPVITKYSHGTFVNPGFCSGDATAAKAFYTRLFKWDAHDMQMAEGSFTLFKLEGHDVAGMYQMSDDRKQAGVLPHWNSYLAVDDAEEIVAKSIRLGAQVLMKPTDMGGDIMANLEDPTGVKFSVWQINDHAASARLDEVGALCWTELCTTDAEKSGSFYAQLLGWNPQPYKGQNTPMPYTVFERGKSEKGAGGMMQLSPQMEGVKPQWLPYFQVADTENTAERARELGGHVDGPWDIETVGRIAMIRDTEGAGFAIICPTQM